MNRTAPRHRLLYSLPALGLLVSCHASVPVETPASPDLAQRTSASIQPAAHAGSFQHYAVASDQAEASRAGAQVLAAGGNAADAAAATMLALGVVNPSSSGLGGGGFALYYQASDRSLHFLDFRERAPGAASPTMFVARPGEPDDQARMRSRLGGLAVGVPGEPAGIEALVKRFGRLDMARVVAPALKLARGGFLVGDYLARAIGLSGRALLLQTASQGWPKPAAAGATMRNPLLAETLQGLAEHGAGLFYEGPLAARLVRAVRDAGGVLSAEDLRAYRVVQRAPLEGRALGRRWVSAPPPSAGGYTLLASLQTLEHLRASQPGLLEDPAARAHALIESWKGPYLDRARYFGDPDQIALPMKRLRAPARARARAQRVRPDRAQPPERYRLALAQDEAAVAQPDNAGTSHLCVADAEGNVAAVTTTVNLLFGSRLSAGGLWLNNEMDDFAREVGKANAFGLVGGSANLPAPGKRPVSSMSPTLVLGEAGPELCIGASGGSRIITAVQQVAMAVLIDGSSPGDAVVAPRIHHQASPDEVQTMGLSDDLRRHLRERGHVLTEMRSPAHVQSIAIRPNGGGLLAASDPTKGGAPAGL